GYPVIAVSALRDAAPLAPWTVGHHSVMIGQSGMGKSSLINALVPNAAAPTRDVSTALRSGRHTTSSAILYHLGPPSGDDRGWIIDSPGMTLFGLAHYAAAAIEHAFVELRGIAAACRFRNCRHDQEPGCAVTQSLRDGRIAPQRAALLRTLLNESQAVARAVHRR
ncbi:MAG: ribosome small subunit-dependent GTPase A, partial [Casimicrobiaceae bacterium]